MEMRRVARRRCLQLFVASCIETIGNTVIYDDTQANASQTYFSNLKVERDNDVFKNVTLQKSLISNEDSKLYR